MTKVILLSTLAFSSLTAMADYQQCVLSALSQARKASACQFDDLQTQLISANRGCNNEFIKMLDDVSGGEALSKVTAQIPGIKASTDQASQEMLQAELEHCGYSGSVKVGKGGINLQLFITK